MAGNINKSSFAISPRRALSKVYYYYNNNNYNPDQNIKLERDERFAKLSQVKCVYTTRRRTLLGYVFIGLSS